LCSGCFCRIKRIFNARRAKRFCNELIQILIYSKNASKLKNFICFLDRLKPANSLFIISDVNGNLVEYVLDVLVDTSKSTNNKPTNDSPIQLKITPKAQWPLQRFISSDEVSYPIEMDNPLLMNDVYRNCLRKQSSSGSDSSNSSLPPNFSPNSLLSYSPSLYTTAHNSLSSGNYASLTPNNGQGGATATNNDWIKMIEVSTHIGPHRRLFMGPQFVFKTFNSNLTTTMLNPTSSSVMSDVETPIIDLSGDIELNSLE
jgi:breast carcinoma-amplified sequence 3